MSLSAPIEGWHFHYRKRNRCIHQKHEEIYQEGLDVKGQVQAISGEDWRLFEERQPEPELQIASFRVLILFSPFFSS